MVGKPAHVANVGVETEKRAGRRVKKPKASEKRTTNEDNDHSPGKNAIFHERHLHVPYSKSYLKRIPNILHPHPHPRTLTRIIH